MTTGYVWHELFGWHDTGTHAGILPPGGLTQPYHHLESAESKTRLASLVEVSGLGERLRRLPVTAADEQDILRVHTVAHLRRIRQESAHPRGGDAGDGTSPFGPGGYAIAALAVGGAIAALTAVVDGTVANAYALVRPPGHHARPETGMGFCIFANAAIAIRRVRATHGVGRVAVVDWDVHHGNGTQAVFLDDPDTLTISIHQDDLFPRNSGATSERGVGAGVGSAVNVPLPAGSGNGAYLAAMSRIVQPALERFGPDVIVVSSGFDASVYDPLGRMLVTADGYRQLTAMLMEVAATTCDGRIAMMHEGGYSPMYVPVCGLAVLEELSGIRTGVRDDLGPFVDTLPDQPLTAWQAAAIDAARVAAGL